MTPAIISPFPSRASLEATTASRIEVVLLGLRRVLEAHPELLAEWERYLLAHFLAEEPRS
jgi:hypothetical protein